MKEWRPPKILELLRDCGKIALGYYDNPPLELKSDRTFVTAADKAIEAQLALAFDHPAAGSYLIGEETIDSRDETYLQKAFDGIAWIVDPIDGTTSYCAHFPAWGISVALMEKGKIIEGAVYFPPQDEVFYTCGPEALKIRNFSIGGRPEPADFKSQNLNPAGIVSISQYGAKYCRLDIPNQMFALSSCVGSFYGLFTGRFLAYVASVKLWDIAGSIALMERSPYIGITNSGLKLTSEVNDSLFELSPASGNRWRLRGSAIIASNIETIDYLRKNIQEV